MTTRCHILKLKCTKFDFGWFFAPDPTRELTALPDSYGFKGPTFKGSRGGKTEENCKGEGRGKGRVGKRGKKKESRGGEGR